MLNTQKEMYNVLKSDIESHPNHISWVYNVKMLLSILGFYDVWLNKGVVMPIYIFEYFKDTIVRYIPTRLECKFTKNIIFGVLFVCLFVCLFHFTPFSNSISVI
jgi:hypothetical protein